MTMPTTIRAAFVSPAHNGKPGEGVWLLELPSSPPRVIEVTAVPSTEKTHKWQCVGSCKVLDRRFGGVGDSPAVALASLIESYDAFVAGKWPVVAYSRDPRLPDDPVEVLPLTPADELARLQAQDLVQSGVPSPRDRVAQVLPIRMVETPGLVMTSVDEGAIAGVPTSSVVYASLPPSEPAGATFSIDKKRRLHLWRPITSLTSPRWTCSLLCILLNPSVAGLKGPDDNDLTVKKLMGYAERWGFPRIDVANAYDWISTDPEGLAPVTDTVGSSDRYILALASGQIPATPEAAGRPLPGGPPLILVGWGDPLDKSRAEQVLGLLWKAKRMPHHLGLTQRRSPRHPSRLPYALEPVPWVERCDDCVGPVWSST